MTQTQIEQKLIEKINEECFYTERDGNTKFSVCDHYNWDKDFWAHKNTIIEALKKKGYSVSVSVNWGVTDINVSKKIELNI